MPENKNRNLAMYGGFVNGITIQFKLIARLLGDARVNPLLKLLPIGALIYMIVPDTFPIIDDAALMWLGTYLFVEMCPQDVVQEHLKELRRAKPDEELSPPTPENGEIIDAEYREEQ